MLNKILKKKSGKNRVTKGACKIIRKFVFNELINCCHKNSNCGSQDSLTFRERFRELRNFFKLTAEILNVANFEPDFGREEVFRCDTE